MTLRDKLKQVYTSGNSMTVLQLLHELIDTIDEFDTGLPLYKHVITVDTTKVTFFSTVKDKLTTRKQLYDFLSNHDYVSADMDRGLTYGTATDYNIFVGYGMEGQATSPSAVYLYYVDGTARQRVMILTDSDFTDTVTLME